MYSYTRMSVRQEHIIGKLPSTNIISYELVCARALFASTLTRVNDFTFITYIVNRRIDDKCALTTKNVRQSIALCYLK
jgi:hypothetical protein